jgi:membrane protease YdiL (CAAX protease family)
VDHLLILLCWILQIAPFGELILLSRNEKFPKLLAGFDVYADWQERVDRSERCANGAFTTALATIAIAVTILGIYWLGGEENLFVVEAVWFFLFAVGGWSLTRSPINRLYRYLLVAVAATSLLLLIVMSVPAPQPASSAEMPWWQFLLPLLPILVLWGGVARFIQLDCKDSPFCLLSLRWRPKALLYGSCVAALLVLQLLLARTFTGATLPSQSLDPLGLVGWFGTLILVGSVAEELIFRATIFDYLYKVRGINLWLAVFTSAGINLLFYLPQAPIHAQPEQQALFWVGPAMLSITNSLLWTWERGTNSVIASNVVFRILHLLLT